MKRQLPTPNRRETVFGIAFIFIQLLVIPSIILTINDFLDKSMSLALQNFLCFSVNFLCVIAIFRCFWLESFKNLSGNSFHLIRHVIVNFSLYYLCSILVNIIIFSLEPDFFNANDAAIFTMAKEQYALIAIGTVVLVPPVEETLYRGVLFGKIAQYHPILGYLISMVAFSAIHVLPYIGELTPMQLLLSFTQYLPPAFFLARAYEKSGSIFAPILIHAIVNFIGVVST